MVMKVQTLKTVGGSKMEMHIPSIFRSQAAQLFIFADEPGLTYEVTIKPVREDNY